MAISFNQSGGITADTINILSPQKRIINDTLKNDLLNKISISKKVIIQTKLSDDEAYEFSNQIKSFLLENGYHVEGVDMVITTPPIGKGIFFDKDSNIITVGSG